MPGIEWATAFSVSQRFIEVNALQKSICKIPEELDEVSIPLLEMRFEFTKFDLERALDNRF